MSNLLLGRLGASSNERWFPARCARNGCVRSCRVLSNTAVVYLRKVAAQQRTLQNPHHATGIAPTDQSALDWRIRVAKMYRLREIGT